MTHTKSIVLGISTLVGLWASGSALADSCGGRWTSVTTWSDTLEVAKGHTVVFYAARSSSTSDNSPFNVVGECGGYVLTMPDGKVKVSGICTRKGKDGDSESDEFSLEPGAERGTWRLASGTGRFAGKSYSGWWQGLVDDGKASTGLWGGNCQ